MLRRALFASTKATVQSRRVAHSPSATATSFSSTVLIKWLNVSGGRIRALYLSAISGSFLFISAFFSEETGGGGVVGVATRGPISIKLSLQTRGRNNTEESRGLSAEVVEDMRSPARNVYR